MDLKKVTLSMYLLKNSYSKVFDTAPSAFMSELDDVTKVEKYEISEEQYAKRDDTFRRFKEDM